MRARRAFLAGLFVVTFPVPALADSAAPTTYRSEVTGMQPALDGLDVSVVGGDSFLEVSVAPGSEVEVPGYEGEPYVRISSDGTVEVNRNSPSAWLNEDRYGRSGVPDSASADAEPAWEEVAGGGTYGWHDHRIHWMSPQPPPSIDVTEVSTVLTWEVPLSVDGDEVTVSGTLEWFPPVSPLPWFGVVVAAIAVAAWFGWSKPLLILGSAAATVVGAGQATASPLGPVAEVALWVPPALALVLALTALVWGRPNSHLPVAVGGILLAVWAAMRLQGLWMPVLPGPLPALAERVAIALAVAGAIVSVGGVVRDYLSPVGAQRGSAVGHDDG